MSDRRPQMPKATAIWLVENTSLTFEQVADFCGMHLLEVKGIADGDVAQGLKGMDPVSSGQLTREEIQRGIDDPAYRLKLAIRKTDTFVVKPKAGPRYTPVSRRHDRPNAVLWLLKNHPELKDAQIIRLVGTTKPTILQIRERSHWNSANLVPQDPVTLGLCTQIALDAEVRKSAKRTGTADEQSMAASEVGAVTLLPTAETTVIEPSAPTTLQEDREQSKREFQAEEAAMMAKLRELGGGDTGDKSGDGDAP